MWSHDPGLNIAGEYVIVPLVREGVAVAHYEARHPPHFTRLYAEAVGKMIGRYILVSSVELVGETWHVWHEYVFDRWVG